MRTKAYSMPLINKNCKTRDFYTFVVNAAFKMAVEKLPFLSNPITSARLSITYLNNIGNDIHKVSKCLFFYVPLSIKWEQKFFKIGT